MFGQQRLELTAALLTIPLSVVFLVWSGWVLSAKRIARRELLPFAVIGAVLLARLLGRRGGVRAAPVQHLRHALRRDRRGLRDDLGAFCVMVVLVGSAAAGREIHDELDRIRRGETPPEDEVQRQWDEVTAEARSRWEVVRERVQERRNNRSARE